MALKEQTGIQHYVVLTGASEKETTRLTRKSILPAAQSLNPVRT